MEENKEVIQRVMEIKQEDVDSSDQDPYPRTWLIYYSIDHDILGSSKKRMITRTEDLRRDFSWYFLYGRSS